MGVDNILTWDCPRCKMAFADWDGCNAVYCSYAGCGCNFCPFCLKDCGGGVKFGQQEIVRAGDDAVHKHVQTSNTPRVLVIRMTVVCKRRYGTRSASSASKSA